MMVRRIHGSPSRPEWKTRRLEALRFFTDGQKSQFNAQSELTPLETSMVVVSASRFPPPNVSIADGGQGRFPTAYDTSTDSVRGPLP